MKRKRLEETEERTKVLKGIGEIEMEGGRKRGETDKQTDREIHTQWWDEEHTDSDNDRDRGKERG